MDQLPDAGRIYQRDTTSGGDWDLGAATIGVTGTISTPGALHARLRSAADGTSIVKASWLVDAHVSAAPVDIVLPAAGISALGEDAWWYLDLSVDEANWQEGTTAFTVGGLIATYGQSLAAFMYCKSDGVAWSALGLAASPYTRCFATFNNGGDAAAFPPDIGDHPGAAGLTWQQPSEAGPYASPGITSLLSELAAISDVPFGAIGHQRGAQAIQQLDGGDEYDQLMTVLGAAGGKWELQLFYQGQQNFTSGYAFYLDRLDGLMSAITAANGITATVLVGGFVNSVLYAFQGDFEYSFEIMRAQKDYCDANGGIYLEINGVALVDNVHQSSAGNMTMAREIARACRPVYGLAASDAGGAMQAGSRAGAVITIPVDMPDGATALSIEGSGVRYNFKVHEASDPLRFYPISSVAISGSTDIVITLANDPGNGANLKVDYMAHWTSPGLGQDVSDIRDDLVTADEDTRGITVGRGLRSTAFLGPVDIPLISGSTINSPDYTMAAGDPVSYAAGKFGNGRSDGTFLGLLPIPASWTLEMFVKAVSLPGPRVLWGTEGLMNAFIDSSGKFTLYGATNLGDTGGGVLSNGTTSHVAFVNDGPGQSFKVFADGAEVFSASTGSYPVMGHDQIAQVGFGGNGGSGWQIGTSVVIDEVFLREGAIYASSFAPPTTPFSGSETGAIALFHLNDNLTDAA